MNEMVFHTGVNKIINLPRKSKVEMNLDEVCLHKMLMRKNYLLIYKMNVISRQSWTLE